MGWDSQDQLEGFLSEEMKFAHGWDLLVAVAERLGQA